MEDRRRRTGGGGGGEAESQHIPAEAVSNDVTFRGEKKGKQRRRKQRSGDEKPGLDQQTFVCVCVCGKQ